jgi:acyl-CoA synthetase (AMP-forming)/AMP-acid ligase II
MDRMTLDITLDMHPATLVELLRQRSTELPGDIAFYFLEDGENQESQLTYAELDRQARAIAAWLQAHGLRGERAILLYPPGLGFIAAYFGCLYAGVVAVPSYPPRLNRPSPRIQTIVADSGAKAALTTTAILENLEQRFEHTPDLQALQWLNTETMPAGWETGWQDPAVGPSDLAFLQYTSGSTSTPKGVMLTHGNLIYNLRQIMTGFQHQHGVVGVIWLPNYHDMGLIGGILQPIYVGGRSTLMSPLMFLQRPLRWLEAITRYRGLTSGGPNFAYDLCVEKIREDQKANLDLSSWRVAFTGAEPVRPETLERFSQAFAGCGFRKEAFYPCYGLAEASLIVSGGLGPAIPRTFYFQRSGLENRRVVASPNGGADSQAMVSCGRPLLDEKVVIVDPDTHQPSPAHQIGEIWVTGDNISQGYWGRKEESERTFQACIAGSTDGTAYMRTGDLGFIYDGELFIAGRLKDLIIIRGSNHYPQDIELTVEKAHPGLQLAGGAAFSILVDGEEQLVIVQEVSRTSRNANLDEMIRAIRRAVAEGHDLQAYAVVLIRPMSIPKTSSGKIQRHACKAAFLEGNLETMAEFRMGERPA